MILPYFGVVSEIIAVFSRKPIFGYTGMVLAAFAIAGLSMGVWAHHMFTTGAVNDPFFQLRLVPDRRPDRDQVLQLDRDDVARLDLVSDADAVRVGFLMNFLLGGVTGVMVASPPIDFHARDSYFIVAHIHYMLGGGSLFAIFAALFFWWPKMFGRRLDEGLGQALLLAAVRRLQPDVLPDALHGDRRDAAARRRPIRTPAPVPELNLIATIGVAT